MSELLNRLRAEADAVAAISEDMNEATKGGGGRLLREGYALARLVEYVEFGNQPQTFNGKAKEPALEFQLGFALWGEGYQNEDGTPYVIRPYSMAYSRNEKSRAFLTFRAMNWKGTATHFAQLLSQGFLVKIENKPKSDNDKTLVSRLDLKATLPPLDALSRQPYQIPEAPDDLYRLFLWDKPTKESWASIYIDGTYEDGNSKNRLQEKCVSALNFSGSALEQMLMGSENLALPTPGGAVPAPGALSAPVAGATVPSATVSAPPAVASPAVSVPSAPVVPGAPAVGGAAAPFVPSVAVPAPVAPTPQPPAPVSTGAVTPVTAAE